MPSWVVFGSFSFERPKYEPTLPRPSSESATGARLARALLLVLPLPLLLLRLYCLYEARVAFANLRATAGRAAAPKLDTAVRSDIFCV